VKLKKGDIKMRLKVFSNKITGEVTRIKWVSFNLWTGIQEEGDFSLEKLYSLDYKKLIEMGFFGPDNNVTAYHSRHFGTNEQKKILDTIYKTWSEKYAKRQVFENFKLNILYEGETLKEFIVLELVKKILIRGVDSCNTLQFLSKKEYDSFKKMLIENNLEKFMEILKDFKIQIVVPEKVIK
jgi:hypothetical protein